MLSIALKEAKRSEEIALRLQKSRLQQQQRRLQNPDDNSQASGGKSGKRTRRRRRTKKPKESQPAATLPHVPKVLSKKPHDAPMKKRDLYFCLRCGVVVVGQQGMGSAVGRVVLVNWDNEVVFDKFVKVPLHVVDYKSEATGITKERLQSSEAITFDQARKEVGKRIRGKILIGHGLEVDLASLGLSHPFSDIRDTATYSAFMVRGDGPSNSEMLLPQDLSSLAETELKRDLKSGPLSEAIACLDLYKAARSPWETDLVNMVQQKERQRQMVMSMRAGGHGVARTGGLSVPLSAIREDATAGPPGFSIRPGTGVLGGGSHPSSHDTLSQTSSQSGLVYQQDDEVSSQASSFFSYDTDLGSSISSMHRYDNGRYSEIENLPEFLAHPTYAEVNKGALPSVASDVRVHQWNLISEDGSAGTRNSHHSALSGSVASGVGGAQTHHSQASQAANSLLNQYNGTASENGSCIWGGDQLLGNGSVGGTMEQSMWSTGNEGYVTTTHDAGAAMSEEELLQHLPSELIEDIDNTEGSKKKWYHARRKNSESSDTERNSYASNTRSSDQSDETASDRKKPSWLFGSLRRPKPSSQPSSRFDEN